MSAGVALFGKPDDAGAFDRYYEQTHTQLVQKIPGLKRFEATKIAATPDGSPPAYYLVAMITFDGPEELQAGLQSPEGQMVVQDFANFATGGVTLLLGPTQQLSVTQAPSQREAA